MDARSIAILEFPEIRARLAAQTSFGPSRRLAEALEPSGEPVVVKRRLDETDEARELLTLHPGVGIGAAHDIGPAVERAARGGRLESDQLLEILETLVAAARLGDALAAESRPLLRDLGRAIAPLPHLRATLERSLDPAGGLLDSASPRLGSLRRAVRVAYERLRSRLEHLVHSAELAGVLQEPIVTLRNGRYVVPVRAEAKGRVKGIVHDQSGSGQTLFIEPLVVVELGNAWREAQLAEAAEVERILDVLSALAGAQAGPLRATLDALARFDFWGARARLAAELDAVRPAASTGYELELLGARHPGLTGRVVPIDVRLGGEFTVLVITGPNTGGKTVTLRTVGLLTLMHQAGLQVPVLPGSRLPVFRDVFADIGDEQSIAQSLSTFSSHMRAIVRIVQEAGPGTLVLLDELGAGTDPTEGSALAQALLDHFIRAGALVAATTHYAELKAYAHNTPGARNASVDFDLETLQPTFHLSIGLPGASQAFAIAGRLGLRDELIAEARSRLTHAQAEFESTLRAIKAAEAAAAEAVERARAQEERARADRSAAEGERDRARRERDELLSGARAEAERLLEAIRRELATARERLAREPASAAIVEELDGRVAARTEALAALVPARPDRGPEAAVAPAVAWRVGMRARGRESDWEGRIVAFDRSGRRATIETGGLRLTVAVDELVPAAGRSAGEGQSSASRAGLARGGRRAAGPPVAPVPATLDLRGARVEEALDLLERYLDRASLAGVGRVTIVHGLGTGALRDVVRARLAEHPLVREWRPGERGEGGDGATIVGV